MAVTIILFLPLTFGNNLIIVDVSAQTPHCISDGTGSYDPDWCWYERAVENHPRCIEIFNGYNAMVRASPLWPSNSISLVDPAEWCQLHPPDHPPPLLKSETPVTGCESYTGTEYDDCINSQLDDLLKGVQDPCGDPSNPNYVKCLLGDEPNRTKIGKPAPPPETYPIPCDPTTERCVYKDPNTPIGSYVSPEYRFQPTTLDKLLNWAFDFGEDYLRKKPYEAVGEAILKPLIGATPARVIPKILDPSELGSPEAWFLYSYCPKYPNTPGCQPPAPPVPPRTDWDCNFVTNTCQPPTLPPPSPPSPPPSSRQTPQ